MSKDEVIITVNDDAPLAKYDADQAQQNMSYSDCTFKISKPNLVQLNVLFKYAMMLDFVADGANTINIDGLINSILDECTTKRIKDLTKRHGFDSSLEFMSTLTACMDGEEVYSEIKKHELETLHQQHAAILRYVPAESRQMDLPFE
ncbi:MAG: hypothetical protein IKY83_13030 [Proteobacteria bacterium]|nr:hypothetical protein [Pseudomonadota bacterium]